MSWSWAHGSWILQPSVQSPLKLWVRTPFMARCKVCQWLATVRGFLLDTQVSSTNKTDRHDITEILLKVALNSINPNPPKRKISISLQTCTEVSIITGYYIRSSWCAPSNQKGQILHFSSPVIKGQVRFWRPSLSVLPSGLNYLKNTPIDPITQ
jgi:hypothetical protein